MDCGSPVLWAGWLLLLCLCVRGVSVCRRVLVCVPVDSCGADARRHDEALARVQVALAAAPAYAAPILPAALDLSWAEPACGVGAHGGEEARAVALVARRQRAIRHATARSDGRTRQRGHERVAPAAEHVVFGPRTPASVGGDERLVRAHHQLLAAVAGAAPTQRPRQLAGVDSAAVRNPCDEEPRAVGFAAATYRASGYRTIVSVDPCELAGCSRWLDEGDEKGAG